VVLHETLKAVLSGFDHKPLPQALTHAEALAKTICGLIDGCVGVKIVRPVEGFIATAGQTA
jgi:hypothetical protein